MAAPSHPALAHQFDDLPQQYDAASTGMWAFLLTEIMFFGGLFVAYTVYRQAYLPGFTEASQHLDVFLGTLNTAILIGSSLAMAMAVHAAQTDQQQHLRRFLWLTILLGAIFLGIKGYEYWHKYHENLIPGSHFDYHGAHREAVQLFLVFYFVMTGMHALHMIIGIGLLAVLVILASRGRFSATYHTPIETIGLYWHFVDIIWIFLYPLLYLIGHHS